MALLIDVEILAAPALYIIQLFAVFYAPSSHRLSSNCFSCFRTDKVSEFLPKFKDVYPRRQKKLSVISTNNFFTLNLIP